MTNDEELDLLETWINPLLQPDKRFMALAGAALPVLIDRAGGFVRFTLAEFRSGAEPLRRQGVGETRENARRRTYRHVDAEQEQGSRACP